MAIWTNKPKQKISTRIANVIAAKLPPIPETKLEAYALELRRARSQVRLLRWLLLLAIIAEIGRYAFLQR